VEHPAPTGQHGRIVSRFVPGLRFVLAVIVAGGCAGVGAIAFYATLNLVQRLFWGGAAGGWGDALAANAVPRLASMPAGARPLTLVACGLGAGVAAAFNTPLGGALFAIEVAIGATTFEVAWPVILAAVAAQAVSRLYLGDGPLYEMRLSTFHAAPARALPLCA